MFDEQDSKTTTPPGNLPAEPADMFAGVPDAPGAESDDRLPDALSSGLLKKKESTVSSMPNMDGGGSLPATSSGSPFGKILFVIIAILVLGALGLGAWWFMSTSKQKVTPVVPPSQTPTPDATLPAAEPTPTFDNTLPSASSTTPTETNNTADSDHDGLTDQDEMQVYHTDPTKADTDGDGLSDGDEVSIWHTDPLKVDTDGDGFPDSEEVQNGYNPLGPGRMIEPGTPAATTTTPAPTPTPTPSSTQSTITI